MTTIFYLLAFIPLHMEFKTIADPKYAENSWEPLLKFKKGDKLNKQTSLFFLYQVIYISWTLVGIFSDNGPVFLTILLLSFLHSKFKISFERYDSIYCVFAILFMFINHFTWHLNLWRMLYNLI